MARANEETVLAVKLSALHLHRYVNGQSEPKNEIQIADDAATLKSMSRSLHRLAETACNRELTEREIRREESIQMDLIALLTGYGFDTKDIKFNSDPRGYAVKLHFPDGRGNSWGGDSEGWGI